MNEVTTITPRLFTVTEAASYLAVSERTIWNLIKQGDLDAVRFGRITRIDQGDIDRFILECKGGRQ